MPQSIAPELTNEALDRRDAEIARLRAELAEAKSALDQVCIQYRFLSKDAEELRIAARRDAEEIARLKFIVERSVRLLNDACSGYISGSQSDTDWDMQRGQLVTDASAALALCPEGKGKT